MIERTRYRRPGGLIRASWLVLAVLLHGPATAAEECPSLRAPPVAAPRTLRAIEAGAAVVVVALGSSTTQGAMASDRAHTYPAVLQSALAAALPAAHLAVLNRGIGGQDAAEALARLDADVIAARPSLVIWQVGANSILRRSDPALFKRQVLDGVGRLHAAGADVVLMDNQRTPVILASPAYAGITQALIEAAAETGASLFSRDELMKAWEGDGHAPSLFLSPDNLHHNDQGYRCVAEALTASLVDGLSARNGSAQGGADGQQARVAGAATRPPVSR